MDSSRRIAEILDTEIRRVSRRIRLMKNGTITTFTKARDDTNETLAQDEQSLASLAEARAKFSR